MSIAAALLLALGFAQAAPDLAAAVPPGGARVVVYRNGAFYFGGRGCSAYALLGGRARRIAELGRSEYAVLDADPGTLILSGTKRLKNPVTLRLAADETAYVRCEVAGMMGSSRLVLSDAPAFDRIRDGMDAAD